MSWSPSTQRFFFKNISVNRFVFNSSVCSFLLVILGQKVMHLSCQICKNHNPELGGRPIFGGAGESLSLPARRAGDLRSKCGTLLSSENAGEWCMRIYSMHMLKSN